MRRLALIYCCLCAFALAACTKTSDPSTAAPPRSSGDSQAKAPLDTVVRSSAAEVQIPAGGSAEAAVRLSIAEGYHINANPPTYPYLKATELTFAASEGISMDQPMYPAPMTKKFAFAEKPLAVYEHEATIKVPLHAGSTAAKGTRTLAAKLRIQACDEKACYPPQTVETSIPVTIK